MTVNNEKILCYLRKTWLSLRILGLIASLLIAVGFAYAKISANSKAIEKTATKSESNENAIIGLQKDVGHIKETTDRIWTKLEK